MSVALQPTVFRHRVLPGESETSSLADANEVGLRSDDSASYHIHGASAMWKRICIVVDRYRILT